MSGDLGMNSRAYCPAAENDALVPWLARAWRDGLDGFGDTAHYSIGVIVELRCVRQYW